MSAFSINPNKQWRGMFPGNYAGNIWASQNINLEREPGRILLADKLIRIASGLGVVNKFIQCNATATDQWWGLVLPTDANEGDGNILRNGNSVITAGTWIADDTLGAGDASPNNVHDMVVHESSNGEERLLISTATNIAILNKSGGANVWDIDWGSTVASGGIALQDLGNVATVYHWMAHYKRLVAVYDEVTSGNYTNIPVIHTIDRNDVFSANRILFPTGYSLRCIITTNDGFWFAFQSNFGGTAKVFFWDSFSLDYNTEYDLIGSYPLMGFSVRNIPYFITENGYILKFTGGGFEKVQDLDFEKHRVSFSITLKQETCPSPYGSAVEGDIVYLNLGIPMVDQESGSTVFTGGVRRGRSGIWIFNAKTLNLYHHMGFNRHATAGTDINYCDGHIDAPGAVVRATIAGQERLTVASASLHIGTGANWKTNQANGIYRSVPNINWVSSTGRNRGYFITPYIPIQDITGLFQGVWIKFKRFIDDKAASPASSNRIFVKWRCRDSLTRDTDETTFNTFMQAAGDWVSTTTFTCVVPTGVAVNDEVEILTGDNSGCSFRISALSATPDSSTSITVTIEEAAPTDSTDNFLCRFDNWETETAISAVNRGSFFVPFTAGAGKNDGEFIQLKVEMRGFGVEIDDIIPVYQTNEKADF